MLPVIAEVVRSGFVEGHHYGSVVALDGEGRVVFERGDTTSVVLPRSANKPLQALGMVRAGFDLDGELLALACASHSGEDFHLDGVRRILAHAGLDESALQTPPDYPLDDVVRDELLRAGGTATRLHMNCSGKHAAMLATCVLNGWPTAAALPCSAPRCAAWPGRSRRWPPATGPKRGGSPRRSGGTRSSSRARAATSWPCCARSRARSARPAPSPATRSPFPTGGRSR